MDQIFNSLQENTLHMVLLAAVAIYLVFAILKRVIRIILIAGVILVVYLLYLHFNGADDSVSTVWRDENRSTTLIHS